MSCFLHGFVDTNYPTKCETISLLRRSHYSDQLLSFQRMVFIAKLQIKYKTVIVTFCNAEVPQNAGK